IDHTQLDVETDLRELLTQYLAELPNLRELRRAHGHDDRRVDRRTVRRGLLDELRRLLGVVLPRLELVVVADDPRWDQLGRDSVTVGVEGVDDPLLVDRVVDRLTNANVVERRRLAGESQRDRLVVRV